MHARDSVNYIAREPAAQSAVAAAACIATNLEVCMNI